MSEPQPRDRRVRFRDKDSTPKTAAPKPAAKKTTAKKK